MQAVRELYKIGRGPSSSHTLAPERACRMFVQEFGPYPHYEAELYGSLSLTGRGHNTDEIIRETLPGTTEVKFCLDWKESFPNGFYLRSYDDAHHLTHQWTVFSLGGGSLEIKEKKLNWNDEVYEEKSFREVAQVLKSRGLTIPEYLYAHEPDLKGYLKEIMQAELDCVSRGLQARGTMPGKLHMTRSAGELLSSVYEADAEEKDRLKLMAYSYAASEENATRGTVVTAPTLGACGVMAALVNYEFRDCGRTADEVADALAVAGLFGNLIKSNATISGAVGGCQAEVGAAVSMASAAFAYLAGGDASQIEYAAEIGMEHNLGLTCDPVMGYVMIPCIERNAMGILRARDAALLSCHMSAIRHHLVSFDMVVDTMKETGKQLPRTLRETSEGGLAMEFSQPDRSIEDPKS